MTYRTAILNQKYKNLAVNSQILRAFAATKKATTKLFDGSSGLLKSRYFVEDILVDGEIFQIVNEVNDIQSKIKTIAIDGEIVAKRTYLDGKLLTTGYGWREYHRFLPEKLRI